MPPSSRKRRADDSSDNEPDPAPKVTKKAKSAATTTASGDSKDEEGNAYWELSAKRRVGVSQFKKMCFVNIREFYEKDDKMLPGKKGISLSVEQYIELIKAVPGINSALRDLGYVVPDSDDKNDEPVEAPKVRTERTKLAKSNIEATSDEDSS